MIFPVWLTIYVWLIEKMRLDVGCGHSPTGDINIDLHIQKTSHRSLNQNKLNDYPLNVKLIPNFIRASAEFLPFKNSCFNKVFSSHTLEHCNGLEMFREMVRVSKNIIEIVCPNQVGCGDPNKTLHVYPVNLTWFIHASRIFKLRVIRLKYSGFLCFPHRFIPLVQIPNEISYKASKNNTVR